MKKPWIALAASVAMCAAHGPMAADAIVIPEQIEAVVNHHTITCKDVEERVATALQATGKSIAPVEARQALIEEQLLLVEAERLLDAHEALAKKIEQQTIDQIERERQRAGGHAAFNRKLEKGGLTYKQYVQELREQIMSGFVVYQFVDLDLSVSPAELKAHYRKNIAQYQRPAEVKYRQIFIRANRHPARDGLDFDKAHETAALVLELAKRQHDFAALARKYSDGPNAGRGGLWNFMRRGVRPVAVDKLLFSLQVGEVGGPAVTEVGVTIVKLEERREARTIPFEEVQGQIERLLLEEERARRYRRLIERLEKEHYVKRFPATSNPTPP